MNTYEFAEAIGVTHGAICQWQGGNRVSPFNRMRLLAFAKDAKSKEGKRVPTEIVAALEATQPELRPE